MCLPSAGSDSRVAYTSHVTTVAAAMADRWLNVQSRDARSFVVVNIDSVLVNMASILLSSVAGLTGYRFSLHAVVLNREEVA